MKTGELSSLAEILGGYAFKSTWFEDSKDDKIIRIGDIQEGYINSSSCKTFDSSSNKVSDKFKAKQGDLLMALSGATTGKFGVVREEQEGFYVNQRVAIIRAKEVESQNYLRYVFTDSVLKSLLVAAGGAAQPNLSPKKLSDLKIPLPPLAEQRRIAAILDKADGIRRKQQQAIDLCDQFLKALFIDMFGDPVTNPKGWEVKKLEELVPESCPVTYGIVQPGEDFKNGIPVVRPVDFTDNIVTSENLKKINPEIADSFKRTRLNGGEILVCVRGTTGLLALAGKDLEGANVTRGITPIWFQNDLVNYFMYNQLKSDAAQNYIKENTYGATLKQINLSKLRELPLINPPLDLQNKFAEIVKKTEAKKAKMQKSLERLNDNFNALSQKAFKGEL